MRRPVLVLGSLLVAASLAFTGCGSDPSGGSKETKTLTLTIADGVPDPRGEVVKVDRDQPIVFRVTSDVAGTMHVHSTPDHEFDYGVGETTTEEFSIPTSGVVEVELHDPALQVYRLEVQ